MRPKFLGDDGDGGSGLAGYLQQRADADAAAAQQRKQQQAVEQALNAATSQAAYNQRMKAAQIPSSGVQAALDASIKRLQNVVSPPSRGSAYRQMPQPTAPAAGKDKGGKSSSSSTLVIGVLAVAGIAGGAWWWFKGRKRR